MQLFLALILILKRYFVAISSYGECCIDDVTASHAKANDAIVHFGHCCLSTETETPGVQKKIIYVLPSLTREEIER